MIDVIVAGAFGAQCCHALKIFAACDCDNFQDTPNTSPLASGNTLSRNSIATPKLPPPPPLHAQYGSGSDVALAARIRDWLSTTGTCWIASQVRPCDLASSPCPPPMIWPAMPTVGQHPARSARPLGRLRLIDVEQRCPAADRNQACGLVDGDIGHPPEVDHHVARLRKAFAAATAPRRAARAVQRPARPGRRGARLLEKIPRPEADVPWQSPSRGFTARSGSKNPGYNHRLLR